MIERAMDYARKVFAGDASGHDFDHTLRVYRLATTIAKEENANLEIVQLAALLHDVDDRKLSPQTYENKDNAVTFLRKNGVEQEKIKRIIQIISQISFSAGNGAPSTLEGMCVQDADRLDAIGAIGIGRAFAFGGSRGRQIHDPEGKDKTTTIQHFYDKLLLLKDRMNTESGKKLARQRHQFMEDFLHRFYAEWNGDR
jgi:uncharacterized protein